MWSRNLVSYQAYFVVGVMVAFHFERVIQFMRRWHRQVLVASAAVGVTTLVWYLVVIWQGASTASASDVYEPIAVLWSFGAIAGFFALSWRWRQRRSAGLSEPLAGGPAQTRPAQRVVAAVVHGLWHT